MKRELKVYFPIMICEVPGTHKANPYEKGTESLKLFLMVEDLPYSSQS